MTEATVTPEPRSGRDDRRKSRVPGHAFWKGAAAGLLVVIPAAAIAVYAAALVGILDHDDGLIDCLRMAVVFSGLAAVLTAGGVGRLAAAASMDGGRRRAMIAAARAMAAAGAALTLIAAIPHGGLPMTAPGWLALAATGALTGAAAGALIGLVCGGEMPTLQELGVWPPTEWPLPWPRDDDDDDGDQPAADQPVTRDDPEPRP